MDGVTSRCIYIRFLQVCLGQTSSENLVERHQRAGEHRAQQTDGKEDLVAAGGEAELEQFPLRWMGDYSKHTIFVSMKYAVKCGSQQRIVSSDCHA